MTRDGPASDRKATAAALAAIAGKYHPPRYVLALEVWSGTHEVSRFIDAVALDLFNGDWHAFEVKASTADFQHDFRDGMEKSAWARARVNFFWFVEARPDVIPPAPFGLLGRVGVMTLRDGKLEGRLPADRVDGEPDKALFLGFAKRLVAGPKGDALREVREAAFKEGLAKGKEDRDFELERAKHQLAKAKAVERPARVGRCEATYRCRYCDAAYCLPFDNCPSCGVPDYPRSVDERGWCVKHATGPKPRRRPA